MVDRRLFAALAVTLIGVGASAAIAGGVQVTDCGMAVQGNAELVGNLDCSSYPGHALELDGRIRLNGFTLTGIGSDLSQFSVIDCPDTGAGCRIRVKGPGTVSGGSDGVSGGRVSIRNATVEGAQATGLSGARVKVRNSTISGNGTDDTVSSSARSGVHAGKTTVIDSSIVGNGSFGINSVRVSVRRSTVQGNGLIDIRSYEKPGVRSVVCDTSARGNLGQTWGVCSAD